MSKNRAKIKYNKSYDSCIETTLTTNIHFSLQKIIREQRETERKSVYEKVYMTNVQIYKIHTYAQYISPENIKRPIDKWTIKNTYSQIKLKFHKNTNLFGIGHPTYLKRHPTHTLRPSTYKIQNTTQMSHFKYTRYISHKKITESLHTCIHKKHI